MKEESRIEALENELKILKNEIQATLLEIREQILNHYYPELRAEEPMRSSSLPVRPQVGRPGLPAKATPRTTELTSTISQLEAKGQIEPFSDIFLEDLSEEGEEQDDGDHALVNSRRPSAVPFVDDSVDVKDYGDNAYDDNDYDADDADLETSLAINLQDFIDDDSGTGFEQNFDDVSENRRANIKPLPSQPPSVTQTNMTQSTINSVAASPRNTASNAPQTREINFRQLKQETAASAPKATPVTALPSSAATGAAMRETHAPKANKQTLAALAAWVTESVEKVGKKRTNQIVETYATGGKLTRETQSSLVQLIALADDEEPVAPVGSREMLPLMVALDEILG